MISVVTLWETLMQSAKTGTSGYQDEDEFNRDLSAVQTQLMSILSPLYGRSSAVKELLAPFVEPLTGTSSATGVLAKPADYFQIAAVAISGFPVKEVSVNERFMLQYVPSRRPSTSEKRFFYFMEGDDINLLPAEAHIVSGTYLRHPEEASIALTESSTADSDYVTPTAVDDLEWPQRAFNLILYLMMQRLGLEMKEQLMMEMGNLGIQMESVNL